MSRNTGGPMYNENNYGDRLLAFCSFQYEAEQILLLQDMHFISIIVRDQDENQGLYFCSLLIVRLHLLVSHF